MVSQSDGARRLQSPERTCVGCRQRTTKSELLRLVVWSKDGAWSVRPDPLATAPGRGAYLHPTVECLELAERRRAFVRAFRYDPGAGGALALDELRQHLERLTVIDR